MMSEFQNTIDILGDEFVTKMLIERTINEFSDDVMTNIGFRSFAFCRNLRKVDMPNLQSAEDDSFWNCESLESVNLPNLKTGNSLFEGCINLPVLDLPKLTTANYGLASRCTKLWRVNLPVLASISNALFSGCTSLIEVNIPLLKSIKSSCFSNCKALEHIELPSVTSIEHTAFMGCSSLKNITLPATPPNLVSFSAFTGSTTVGDTSKGINADCIFHIPIGSYDAYAAATNWSTIIETYTFQEDAQ